MQRTILICVLTFLVAPSALAEQLYVRHDTARDTISVFQVGFNEPILTQNVRPDFRPYIHPIVAPDRRGLLTEYDPENHPHQTGLYWGFTSVNGRDFFHHYDGDYWRRFSATILKPEATKNDPRVQWQTIYDLLDEAGEVVMRETQTWTMNDPGRTYVLDLQWSGTAMRDITIGEFDYGGLFLRMPWRDGMNGQAVNSNGQVNEDGAEGQRARWLDIGMQVEGRGNLAHIAILDHPENVGFPQPWRVDGAMGVGPVRARLGDWEIPKGETAQIKHRLLAYTGEFDKVRVASAWSSYTRERGGKPYAQWDQTDLDLFGQQNVEDVETVEEAYRAEFLTPEKAVAAMTVPDGFEVNVFASEPMITQPMAFCWDDRGRLWIAQNREYDGIENGIELSGESQILILEDTDRDGVADSKKVFLDGVVFPSAMSVGFGGLWLGAVPNLLFIPDRDGDDRADVEDIEVRLTGWGRDDLHEIFNSFNWGPDGWLYGLQGIFTHSRVGKPAGESRIFRQNAPYPDDIEYADEPTEINAGVWRYHPIKDRFEVVAHGLSNPWGIDYNAKGQLFATACVIPHLWHVVPGGIYHRQSGSHFNQNVYSSIRTIGDHRHRSAHGGARVYLSDAFPEAYQGRLFMGNIHDHAVLTDILEPRGSGFVGRHGDDFLKANNAQFVGFSTEIGPEGAVYMLDWHDAEICSGPVRNKETGRVYRILPKESNAQDWEGRYDDIRSLSNAELVDLQLSKSEWHARRARVVLQHRAAKGQVREESHAALRELFETNTNGDHRLRALWALHVSGGIDETGLLEALHDEDEYIRAWAIQLLCEDKAPTNAARTQFVAMAKEDESSVVRLYLASALQRMRPEYRWPVATILVSHAEDAEDHNIPKITWFGMEPLVADNPKHALNLADQSRIPMLTQFIGRRLTVGNHLTELVEEIGRNPNTRQLLLLGMRDGLEGRFDLQPPENWRAVFGALSVRDDESTPIARQLSLKFGDLNAAQALLETLQDGENSLEDRQEAIRGLAGLKRPELRSELVALLDDDFLRTEAIRAMSSFDDESLAETLLERYANFSNKEKLEVVHALASRPGHGWALTRAIRRGDVPRRDVPAYVARLLQRVVGNRFLEIWGPVERLSPEAEASFVRFRTLLTDEAIAQGDLAKGRELYTQTCSACHQLNGEGGLVGPDLTGANRTDLEYLLGNILTPSAIIGKDYLMTMVFTDDGRVYAGVVIGENDQQLQLRTASVAEPITIAKSQIVDREITKLSMMPEGLLDNLTDPEVINLFAYLRNLTQVPMQDAANR
ncbi:MAG: PmoA family protein [Pirellulaceae bacterium]|nr:PmoA family protein [Pirellulaceae bacterium]